MPFQLALFDNPCPEKVRNSTLPSMSSKPPTVMTALSLSYQGSQPLLPHTVF